MISSVAGRGALALAVAVSLGGCASSSSGALQTAPTPVPLQRAPIRPTPNGTAKAQADSARYPYTAADIAFMSGMISHHAQAIVMANWAPTHTTTRSIRILTERIINAQSDEIAIMQQWLADRHQPVPEPNPAGMKMMMSGVEHQMLMPGMLTAEQMKQLDAAQGKDFDRQFLTFMIQHHKGATSMVRDLFNTYGAGQDELVFKFASDVNVDQTTEIDRMERMLAEYAGSGAP